MCLNKAILSLTSCLLAEVLGVMYPFAKAIIWILVTSVGWEEELLCHFRPSIDHQLGQISRQAYQLDLCQSKVVLKAEGLAAPPKLKRQLPAMGYFDL